MGNSQKNRKIILRTEAKPQPESMWVKGKDFGKVLQKHSQLINDLHRKPLYKNRGLFLGLLLIAIIAWLVFLADAEKNMKKEKGKKEIQDARPLHRDSL